MTKPQPGAAPAIHWFRQDLRIKDNRALSAAAAGERPVIPVYVLDDASAGAWAMGGASRWWLHGSLTSLDASLRGIGSRLTLRSGPTVETLLALAEETGARSIYFTRCYEPWAIRLENELHAACREAGIALHRHGGALLHEPETIATKGGEPYRVFTPFWRCLLSLPAPRPPLPAPDKLATPAKWPRSEALKSWALAPSKPDWAGGMRAKWQPGEQGAAERLTNFLQGQVATYADDRDRPDRDGTSMLSPYLHFGELSPAQIWSAVTLERERNPATAKGGETYLREIGWREFSYHLLYHWPTIVDQPFRPEFGQFPWETDGRLAAGQLAAWQRGRTGYPIVDAGMRQLWQTGWMHNRVRMIVASFLTKHLRLSWQQGEVWFWDTLVDADLASNAASWQWVAGSGADAAPYFRIFNPILQGRKFDPDGAYVRQYVPELAKLPNDLIHSPWEAPPAILAAAGVELGRTYPHPIVSHEAARKAALAAYDRLKAHA